MVVYKRLTCLETLKDTAKYRHVAHVYTRLYNRLMTKTKTQEKRIKTAIYFEPEQKAALKALSKQTRVPWSIYVREGIDMVLAKYKGGGKRR